MTLVVAKHKKSGLLVSSPSPVFTPVNYSQTLRIDGTRHFFCARRYPKVMQASNQDPQSGLFSTPHQSAQGPRPPRRQQVHQQTRPQQPQQPQPQPVQPQPVQPQPVQPPVQPFAPQSVGYAQQPPPVIPVQPISAQPASALPQIRPQTAQFAPPAPPPQPAPQPEQPKVGAQPQTPGQDWNLSPTVRAIRRLSRPPRPVQQNVSHQPVVQLPQPPMQPPMQPQPPVQPLEQPAVQPPPPPDQQPLQPISPRPVLQFTVPRTGPLHQKPQQQSPQQPHFV